MSSQSSSLAVIVWLVAYSQSESYPRSRRASRRCRRGRATKHHPRRRARGEGFSSTMVKINFEDYKPVKIKTGRVSVTSGDEVNRETLLTTKTIRRHPDVEPQTFVHIRTRDVWLQRATMGQWSRGDDFSMGVLRDIRRKVIDLEKRVRRNLPLHDTNDNGSPRQREDPMHEMEDIGPSRPALSRAFQ